LLERAASFDELAGGEQALDLVGAELSRFEEPVPGRLGQSPVVPKVPEPFPAVLEPEVGLDVAFEVVVHRPQGLEDADERRVGRERRDLPRLRRPEADGEHRVQGQDGEREGRQGNPNP
jgi:hypothetical protein